MPVREKQDKELIYNSYNLIDRERSDLHFFPKFKYWCERDYVDVYILIRSIDVPKNLLQIRILFLPMKILYQYVDYHLH